jgi:hypothetical protein
MLKASAATTSQAVAAVQIEKALACAIAFGELVSKFGHAASANRLVQGLQRHRLTCGLKPAHDKRQRLHCDVLVYLSVRPIVKGADELVGDRRCIAGTGVVAERGCSRANPWRPGPQG